MARGHQAVFIAVPFLATRENVPVYDETAGSGALKPRRAAVPSRPATLGTIPRGRRVWGGAGIGMAGMAAAHEVHVEQRRELCRECPYDLGVRRQICQAVSLWADTGLARLSPSTPMAAFTCASGNDSRRWLATEPTLTSI